MSFIIKNLFYFCNAMGVFSKTCEYGLRAVFYIAHKTVNGNRVGLKEIAKEIDSPEQFLAKILQDLSRKGIIQSAKGPHGGFYINEVSLQKPLSTVVEAIDGDSLFKGCAMGLKFCSAKNPCPLHTDFLGIRDEIEYLLKNTTIGKFNGELTLGLRSLKK